MLLHMVFPIPSGPAVAQTMVPGIASFVDMHHTLTGSCAVLL